MHKGALVGMIQVCFIPEMTRYGQVSKTQISTDFPVMYDLQENR